MARNFRVAVSHHDHKCLHLRLTGDFDGSAAYGLIDILKENGKAKKRIVIDTDGLRNVYTFGVVVFSKFRTPKKNEFADIRFTGVYGSIFST